MWHRPDLLNRTANGLYAAGALLIAYGVLWTVVHLPWFAVRRIEVSGAVSHVTREQIQAIVNSELKGTFFTLNLPHVRRAFEKLPWVREVKLRRHWPDQLEVSVLEHVPLARWGSGALVNTQGEIFHAAYDGKLPVFIGPPGSSKEVAIQYKFSGGSSRRSARRRRSFNSRRAGHGRCAWKAGPRSSLAVRISNRDF